MEMRECIRAVDVKRCGYGVLALAKIISDHSIGSKRACGGLVAVNGNLVESRAVLLKSDLNAVTFNLVVKVKLIGKLAAVEGKSLLGDVSEIAGKGVKAVVDGKTYYCGNGQLMDMCGAEWHDCHLTGTIIHVARETEGDVEYLGHIIINDQIKEDSEAAIKELKNVGVKRLVMLTGDNTETANAIAKMANIDHIIADVLPTHKAGVITSLRQEGKTVLMVGDGINDAPALAAADVGIAIGAGTDIAIESADVVLSQSSLSDAVSAISLSRATVTVIRENLFWALFYNAVCIPIAAGVLSPLGITLTPMIASAAMSFSSVCVVLNSLRLKYKKIYNRRIASYEKKRMF